jgi:hypothetical protein
MGARGITRSSLGETTAKGKIPNSICHSFLNLTIAFFEKRRRVVCMLPNGVCVYDHENGSFFLFPPHQICFLRSINAFA